jgi:5'-methylthioadenosine phosphorylase
MKDEIAPGHLVVVDQFIDLTKRRTSTFFDEGLAAHVPFADPVCPLLSRVLAEAASPHAEVHRGGTYVCIEGPQFSSRAESLLYRSWGVSVIGMTGMPEAKLAREACLPYAMLALATDYDCWKESEGAVHVEAVVATMAANVGRARSAIRDVLPRLPDPKESEASRALHGAVMTQEAAVTAEGRARLRWLLDDPRVGRPFSG